MISRARSTAPSPPSKPEPGTRPRREARATYDRLSRWYDLLAGPWERPFREAGLQKLDE